uniref:Clostripain n=1 Tax=Candidatus Caldatribacterium californiense TaxID=1454726 RepID=A0A7V3YH98_9BACT
MRRRSVLFGSVVLLLFLFSGCQLPPPGGSFPESGRQWTVMVYMAADNDLTGEAWKDIDSMELAGSSGDVAIVVQVDTPSGAWRYLVARDATPGVIASLPLGSLGRVDSGSGETLLDFIRFARSNYPAAHYALILWNHGSGVKATTKDIAFDFTTQRAIALPELRSALTRSGMFFDFLGMDACLMQMVEVAYEVRHNARVLVASQENVPGEGWDYETVFRELTRNPSMDAITLARIVVESYAAYYGQRDIPGRYTLSAVDLSRVSGLASAIDALALAILNDFRTPPWVYVALGDSALYFGDPDFVDLGDFMELLLAYPGISPGVQERAQVVLGELRRCVLYAQSVGSDIIGTSGLSIYFPYTEYVRKYESLEFASATSWDELVRYLIPWRYKTERRWKYASLRGSDSSVAQRGSKELLEAP